MRREQSIVQLPQDKARALDPSPRPTTFVLLHEKHSAVYIGVPSANLVLYAGSARDSESDVDGELTDGTIQSRIAAHQRRSDQNLRRFVLEKAHFSRAPATQPTCGDSADRWSCSGILLVVDPAWEPSMGAATISIVER